MNLEQIKSDYVNSLIVHTLDTAEKLRQDKGESNITEEYIQEVIEERKKTISERFDKFHKQITEKTYKNYFDVFLMISFYENKESKKAFTAITGLKLPKTVKGIKVLLMDYYGKEMIEQAQEQKMIECIKYEKELKEQRFIKDLETSLVSHNNVTMTRKNFIEKIIEQGFNRVEETTKGVRRMKLWKEDSTYFSFRTKEEMFYILKCLDIPVAGRTYYCFDNGVISDGKMDSTRIIEVIPFENIDSDILELWKEEVSECAYLYAQETDYFAKGILWENSEYERVVYFIRSICGGWFSLGTFGGRLDVSGKLFSSLKNL